MKNATKTKQGEWIARDGEYYLGNPDGSEMLLTSWHQDQGFDSTLLWVKENCRPAPAGTKLVGIPVDGLPYTDCYIKAVSLDGSPIVPPA